MKGERKSTKLQTWKQPEESVKQKLRNMEVFGVYQTRIKLVFNRPTL